MNSMKDFSDSLVEEILTEVADGFYGERKRVEDQIRVFEAHVAQLEKKCEKVRQTAAMLNFLLINSSRVRTFYRCIGIEGHPFADIDGRLDEDLVVPDIPFVFRLKNRYIKSVSIVYAMVHAELAEYRHGKNDDCGQTGRSEDDPPANLRMVLIMADMINDNIANLTRGKSPSSVLQYARSFNPEMARKERVTGAVSSDYKETLDRKLAFPRIHPEQLPIHRIPEIPAPPKIRDVLIKCCSQIWKSEKSVIRDRLSRLKQHRPG